MKQLNFFVGLICLFSAAGCGPSMGNLTGKVMLDSHPLPVGRVSVQCEGADKPVVFAIIRDGSYRVENVPVGTANFTVETFPPAVPGPRPPSSAVPLNELPVEGVEEVPKVELLGTYVPIPERYRDPLTSGLTVEITGGEQTHDLQLRSE